MEGDAPSQVASLTVLGNQIVGTKYAGLGVFAIMCYDYLLTFSEEVECIWKRKFTFVTFLFVMTRYYPLVVLAVSMIGFFSPLFTPEVCGRYAPFLPFAGGIPLNFFPDIVLAVRVYALYNKRMIVGVSLATYLIAEFSVALWIYTVPGSHPLQVPPVVQHLEAFHICVDIISESLGSVTSASFQFMQTIYDTIIFVMITYKTASLALSADLDTGIDSRNSVTKVLASQGLIYYGVIFSANFVWAMMIIFAPEGLKYTSAFPTLMLVSIMVNRITLELRSLGSPVHNRTSIPGVDTWNQRVLLFLSPRRGDQSTQNQRWCNTDEPIELSKLTGSNPV